MEWNLKAIGNVTGNAFIAGDETDVKPGVASHVECDAVALMARDGKFGDSEDSFVYLFRTVDPNEENFSLHATVRASETEGGADQQSGFGILIADTDVSESKASRHRNSLLVGCFGKKRSFGARIVAGYTDPQACESGAMRSVDSRRTFDGVPHCEFSSEETVHMSVEKTDEGLRVAVGEETLFIPGCDFLATQDARKLCVGFAVARRVQMDVSDIAFETTPGALSKTPEGTIKKNAVRYPFDPRILDGTPSMDLVHDVQVFAGPEGSHDASGTRDDPLSLEAALCQAGAGTEVTLLEGVYKPTGTLHITPQQSGTAARPVTLAAETPRRCVIDGSNMPEELPLFVLSASFWRITGVAFAHSPLSGLTVFGSDKLIRDCEAYENGDSGMLVISVPGAPKDAWPERNVLVDCDSHHNRDEFDTNADGFGVKLRVGDGNELVRCAAYCNVDDGFDLYAKSLTGPTGAVVLRDCIAYGNGRAGNGASGSKPEGIGFKLGGEAQPVRHEAWNCLAFDNARDGFSRNSNPSCATFFCTSFAGDPNAASLLDAWCAHQEAWELSDAGLPIRKPQ